MREVAKRPRARADLEEIWLYTYENWGKDQADRYLRRLSDRIMELAGEPERGNPKQQSAWATTPSESQGMWSSTRSRISSLALRGYFTARWTWTVTYEQLAL